MQLTLAPRRGKSRFGPSRVRIGITSKEIVHLSRLIGMAQVRRRPRDCCHVGKLGSVCLSVATRRDTGRLGLDGLMGTRVRRVRGMLPTNCRVRADCSTARFVRRRVGGVCLHANLAMLVLLIFMLLVALGPHCLFLVMTDLDVGVTMTIVFCCLFKLRVRLCSLTNVAISLGLIVSGAVIVASRVLRQHGLGTFVSMLTTALAAVKTLIVVFFLSRGVQLGLRSFTTMIVVGLTMSLFMTLFFIPSVVRGVKLGGQGHHSLIPIDSQSKRTPMREEVNFFHQYLYNLHRLTRHFPICFAQFCT